MPFHLFRGSGESRESAVMDGYDRLESQIFCRQRRCLRTHRVVIADGQKPYLRCVQVANELHIEEYAGISRVIENGSAIDRDHEAGRLSPVDSLTVVVDA